LDPWNTPVGCVCEAPAAASLSTEMILFTMGSGGLDEQGLH
jgi:hypothetical protein